MAAVDRSVFFTENGKITPTFNMALSEIFSIFDEARIFAWTDEALDKFAVAIGDAPFDADTKELLKNYGVSPDGLFPVEAFVAWYKTKADNDPQGTLEELNKLGYELKGNLIVQKK